MNPASRIAMTVSLAVSLTGAPARAEIKILRNHDFDPGQSSFQCLTNLFVSGMTFATKVVAEPQDYPFTIRKVRVLACGGGVAAWALDLWHDNEDVSPAPDAIFFQSPSLFSVSGTDSMSEIDLRAENLEVANGGVRVGLTYVLSNAPPGVGLDMSGIQPHRNFIGSEFSPFWTFAENVGINGDFILELEIETPEPSGTTTSPATFGLRGSVPNPFLQATRVDFTLAKPGEVRLEVFDVRGRRIRDLATGWRPAGPHSVVWDGRDTEGQRVGAGLYLCRLRQGALEATRRMVLIP